MPELKIIPISYSIFSKGDNPIFGESALHVKLEDDAAGGFIILEHGQENSVSNQVRLDLEELQLITKTAVKLIKEYQQYE